MKVPRSLLPLIVTMALLVACGSVAPTATTPANQSAAALTSVAVLTMVASWNAFFLPLLVLNSEQLYTLPLGIMQFQGQFGADWGRGSRSSRSRSCRPSFSTCLRSARSSRA